MPGSISERPVGLPKIDSVNAGKLPEPRGTSQPDFGGSLSYFGTYI